MVWYGVFYFIFLGRLQCIWYGMVWYGIFHFIFLGPLQCKRSTRPALKLLCLSYRRWHKITHPLGRLSKLDDATAVCTSFHRALIGFDRVPFLFIEP